MGGLVSDPRSHPGQLLVDVTASILSWIKSVPENSVLSFANGIGIADKRYSNFE